MQDPPEQKIFYLKFCLVKSMKALFSNLLVPILVCLAPTLLVGCSVAKLEARLAANPQCKDVINPKTGAVMPCQETDKAFYAAAGLAPAKVQPASVIKDVPAVTPSVASTAIATSNTPAPQKIVSTPQVQSDCKPQIHKKTGGMLPCPPPD